MPICLDKQGILNLPLKFPCLDMRTETFLEIGNWNSIVLLGLGSADAELDLWENWWAEEYKQTGSSTENKTITIEHLLLLCQEKDLVTTFPVIYNCLKILGTVPVTSCECERSISVLRRTKTYLRSTMGQDRFTDLALLYIRRDFDINLDQVIDNFATKHPRRMQLINLLDGELWAAVSRKSFKKIVYCN